MPELKNEALLEEPDQEIVRPVERILAEGHRVIYANNLQVRTSVYDVAIDFGQILDDYPDKIVSHDQVKVFLSPAHAKALAMLLVHAVVSYEKQYTILPETVALPFKVKIAFEKDKAETAKPADTEEIEERE